MKKKNSFSAIVLAIGVILLAVGAFLNFNGNKNKNSSENNDPNDVTDMTDKKDNKKLTNVNGVYELNNVTIRLFEVDSNVSVHLDNKEYIYIGELVSIEDDTLKLKEKNITIKLRNNEIEVSSDENALNGIYKKTSDLSLDEYYSHYYSNKDLDGKYNVYYKNDYYELYMFQVNEETVFVKITNNIKNNEIIYEKYYHITENNVLEATEDNFSVKIVIKDDLLTVEGINFDIEEFIKMNGTYNKVKNLTKNEVVKYCFQ